MSKEVRVVANWKMNKTTLEATEFVKRLDHIIGVISIAAPSTALYACSQESHRCLA